MMVSAPEPRGENAQIARLEGALVLKSECFASGTADTGTASTADRRVAEAAL